MSAMAIACIAAGCISGGTLLGMALRTMLPSDHLNADSKDAIKLSAGMISLMAALVLGLLVSSAKSNFNATNAAITQGGAKVILLDRVLAHYGTESNEVREDLRRAVAVSIEVLWPEDRPTASGLGAFERTSANGHYSSQLIRLQSTGDVAWPEGLGESVPGAAPFVPVTVLLEECELMGPRVHFPRIKPALSGYLTASHDRPSSR